MLLDGSSLVFRAFHGVPATVRAPDGRPVNAVRGFFETLARLLLTQRPRHVAVAADDDWRPAWRVELIPSYKLHRTAEPVPPLLEPQMPVIDEVLDAIGIDRSGHRDYEAEDVISTWCERARPDTVDVVSGDRDLFALVEDPRVRILYPEKGGLAKIDEAEVSRRYGIPGRRYADFAVLRGDPSDGLPGLRGVGAVTAAAMVRDHHGLEGLLAAGRLSGEQRDYIERAASVVRPVTDVPVELPRGRRDTYPVNPARLAGLAELHGQAATFDRVVAAASEVLGAR
ncbi:MAG: 5'-3' exonuclease [Candidatus Dormibacteria bacterium]